MYTVITKGNKVNRVHIAAYGDVDDMIAVNESGKVLVNRGNPITWPTDATNGMQAIVDVKAGTLRFAYDGWPRAATEFVVSEYERKGLHSEKTIVEWPEDAPAGLKLVHDFVTLECKFAAPNYKLKDNEVVIAVKGMDFVPFASVEDCDPVNRPSHYTAGGIECIDAIKASMSTEAFLGFLKGNVQKYMWRYEKKVAPVEDLKKAQWYLSKLIEEQERS